MSSHYEYEMKNLNLLSPTTFVKPQSPYTLESLIQGLDNRGMLVLLVLLGQHAMELLTKDKEKEVTKGLVLPNAEDSRKISLAVTGEG